MKRIFLLLILLSLFICPFVNAEDVSPCGKTYMMSYNNELYIFKFVGEGFAADCYGTMTFYWSSYTSSYKFTTSGNFIDVTGIGTFAIRIVNNVEKLYFIDPNTFILTEY